MSTDISGNAFESLSLKQELEKFGEVRNGGCVLRTNGISFKMNTERNIFIRHELDCANTSEKRLEAHWSGFVLAEKFH
jgi:hypothetical protein